MNIELQVCSLELSKQLDELGVKKDSLFYWEKCPDNKYEFIISSYEYHDEITGEWTDSHLMKDQENYPAYTVAELGEMLPIWHDTCKQEIQDWHVRFFVRDESQTVHHSFAATEANARAKMLIYLIENNLMELLK